MRMSIPVLIWSVVNDYNLHENRQNLIQYTVNIPFNRNYNNLVIYMCNIYFVNIINDAYTR